MSEHKPVQLSLISSYGQGRMTETKPIWLPPMPTYGQERNGKGRRAEPNTYNYSRFPHMDKEEWLRPNLYDYPWFLNPFFLIVPFVFMLFLCYLLFCSVDVSTLKLYNMPYLNFVLDWSLREHFVKLDLSHFGHHLHLKIKWKSYIVIKRKQIRA
jgi:hypothetical protein